MSWILGILATIAGGFVVNALRKTERFRIAASTVEGVLTRETSFYTRTLTAAKRSGHVPEFLVQWLINDQSKDTIHYGQFGRQANPKEEALYQKTGAERQDVKPRMYLTFWPTIVMHKHNMAPRQVAFAIEGTKRLFRGQQIRVAVGASPGMSPLSASDTVSFRHTIKAAHLFLRTNTHRDIVRTVLGQALDSSRQWQNQDGSWAQCDTLLGTSDVWASTYAAAFLFDVLRLKGELGALDASAATSALKRTLASLRAEWTLNQWAHGKVASAENAPLMYHELHEVLVKCDPDLGKAVRAYCRNWLTSTCQVSGAYLEKCQATTYAAASARLGYVIFLSGEDPALVEALSDEALASFDQGLNAADIGFLLDIAAADSRHTGQFSRLMKV
jgi:hypothetical protein